MDPSIPEFPPMPVSALPPQNAPVTQFKDRSTGLLVFGILEIAGGALAALMIPFAFLGIILTRKASGAGMPLGSLASSLLTYLVLAVVLITLGIGATQAKRWAWALNLILSWVSLIMGILITGVLILVLPGSFLAGMRQAAEQTHNAAPMPTGFMAVFLTFLIVFFAIFLIVVPIAFLVFYRMKDVELTCKHRDPVERWTDRRPLPVLAWALLATVGAAYYLVLGFTTPLFPFFGRYLTGPPATLALFVLAVIDACIAVSFFRMKVAGWWLAVAAMTLRIVSTALTFRRANLLDAYSKMGWSSQQMELLQRNPMFHTGAFLWWSVAVMVLYFIFLLWLKRYFAPAAPPSYTGISDSFQPNVGS